MRVYHFLNAEWGLEAIKKRRLKVSRIDDLNDPFELLSPELSNKTLRQALPVLKSSLSNYRGLHCFSKRWTNPVLWSHYAEKHQGICLGFDVPNKLLIDVVYTAKRTDFYEAFTKQGSIKKTGIYNIIRTKFGHWRYEKEVRQLVVLKKANLHNGHYFSNFSDQLKLKQVIVGAESKVSRDDVTKALGHRASHVERFKARAAFKSFRVIKNRKQSLWT